MSEARGKEMAWKNLGAVVIGRSRAALMAASYRDPLIAPKSTIYLQVVTYEEIQIREREKVVAVVHHKRTVARDTQRGGAK